MGEGVGVQGVFCGVGFYFVEGVEGAEVGEGLGVAVEVVVDGEFAAQGGEVLEGLQEGQVFSRVFLGLLRDEEGEFEVVEAEGVIVEAVCVC